MVSAMLCWHIDIYISSMLPKHKLALRAFSSPGILQAFTARLTVLSPSVSWDGEMSGSQLSRVNAAFVGVPKLNPGSQSNTSSFNIESYQRTLINSVTNRHVLWPMGGIIKRWEAKRERLRAYLSFPMFTSCVGSPRVFMTMAVYRQVLL